MKVKCQLIKDHSVWTIIKNVHAIELKKESKFYNFKIENSDDFGLFVSDWEIVSIEREA